MFPYRKFNYMVVIDGITRAGFSEVSAADITVEPIEYREGTSKRTVSDKLPGISKFSNVTLKYGMTDNMEFYKWISQLVAGEVVTRKVVIQLMDENNQNVKAQWELEDAWPTKYTAPDFKGTENAVAIESVELVHHGFKRVK